MRNQINVIAVEVFRILRLRLTGNILSIDAAIGRATKIVAIDRPAFTKILILENADNTAAVYTTDEVAFSNIILAAISIIAIVIIEAILRR